MRDGERPNPDDLLAAIQNESARGQRGRLKVFLGMCPGVGKTFAMLQAAQAEQKAGRRVLLGYVETHRRTETDALSAGLPVLPRQKSDHRGLTLEEMDLAAILSAHPQLAVVDELAHTNVPGSTHAKRWQDVEELLNAGIDVFTTLNVQHIESQADTVRQITGAEIRETVPDSFLDDSDLELVDLPPAELIARLRAGKIYLPDRAASAAQNFFREHNLTALREVALRVVADHVSIDTQEFHRQRGGPEAWKTGHRLMVAVGASPFSESLVRWTRRMAGSLKCPWLAIHVERSATMGEGAQSTLEKNLALARSLGAEVIHTTDEDLARGLLRMARQNNVSQIIVGKPATKNLIDWFRSGRLLWRLSRESGGIDLQIVRADKSGLPPLAPPPPIRSVIRWKQYAVATLALVLIGGLNAVLAEFTGPRVPGFVFLLAVVLLALVLERGPVLWAGAASALAWDFFFLPPRFRFVISHAEDAFLFALYFIVALVLGQLVARIRAQELAERRREERAMALYHLIRELAQASTRDEVAWHLISEVSRVFQAETAVVLRGPKGLMAHPDSALVLTEKEMSVAEWAFLNRQSAGQFTDNIPGASVMHLPLMTERAISGVLSVKLPEKTLHLARRELLEAYARQGALVLDLVSLRAANEQSKLLVQSEQLSNALLNSVSHELRTPLAAITSAAGMLAEKGPGNREFSVNMVAEIQEAAARLNRLVGNLLDVTRLESGHVRPRLDWYEVADLLHTTVHSLEKELQGREVKTEVEENLPLVKMDFALMQQALANLLLNIAIHTPAGTPILVQARLENGALILAVADRGPGLPGEVLPRIFDKFFRAPGAPAGGSGLGLAIVRGFVQAHAGQITAANRDGGGTIFHLRLPQDEPAPAPSIA